MSGDGRSRRGSSGERPKAEAGEAGGKLRAKPKAEVENPAGRLGGEKPEMKAGEAGGIVRARWWVSLRRGTAVREGG
ncbi:hypothetical protein, partial [Nonomuraea antri]|uniref:hypothetical protein n=1 Tax=Nonomuraea antri TaxID=2730852 RepID=UPI001C2CBE17